jgi:uncharacterized small protein (DUF1192 family)
MSLHGKEKIWFLINRLIDEREVTSAGQPVALHPANDLNKHYLPTDFIQLTSKIQKDHKAIKLLNTMPTDQTNGKYLIELLPDFDNYVQELRKDPKYLDWVGEKPKQEPAQTPKISYAQSSAKKNGVMTGKEKIQAVVEEINDAYQGLVTGNTVMVFSGNLDAKDVRLREQKQVLDILANDKKVIKYAAENTYASQADIPPSTQVDVYEIASDVGKTTEEMFDEILEELSYSVEVLSGFEALADELLGNAELEHQQDVYLLRLLYNRVIAILDAVVSAGVVIEDDKLDFVYIKLTSVLESILSKQTMKSWEKDAPELYETLLGHAEDIGEGWQYSRAEVLKYYAKLQKDWMLNSHVEFELDDKLAALFEEIDGLIAEHKKAAREAADNWYKRADAFAKDFRKKGVVINKEPKPQPEYPDDTAPLRDDENEPAEPEKTNASQDKVRFDAKASKLTFDGKSCGIPDETLEYYICKLVFRNRKVAAKEDDILEYTTKSQDSQRAVYDAMLRVNKKAREQLGIGKLLSYKAAKVRITAKYQ